jgi:glutamine synthetase
VPAETAERVRLRLAPASIDCVARQRRERVHGQRQGRGAERFAAPISPDCWSTPAPPPCFTTPTINGYKRYRSYSLAPDRAIWGRDNRGVMIRVLGGPGESATRLENRIGEPAANPYLYMASQILSGLDGVDRKLDPGPSGDTPYETKAALLPKSLREAVFALNDDPFFRQALGAEFVDYYVHIKNAEIERFQAEVSDWEHREYFEMF